MISELYSGGVLDAAAAIPPARRLDTPDSSATKASRVCGSEVTVDLVMKDGVVADFGMEAKACALGQASASLFAKTATGATPEEVRVLRDEMRAMLTADGPAPSAERWAQMATLAPIKAYPARHASTMLVFEAAVDALDQIEAAA